MPNVTARIGPPNNRRKPFVPAPSTFHTPVSLLFSKISAMTWAACNERFLFEVGGDNYLGWFVTASGLSFGAPFSFDLLNKMMVIRSTVKPHEKSPEEASQDRRSNVSLAPNTLTLAA
ncbi:hypothetical protein [Paraburkholderia kirstenboschensis]|uniref:Uncharacterized protein n=1 Tax=Paraburkholderia kirstenboschensis TaxID=1245436 RepID=A0ABZ0EBC2_9BURK|nr:hypothetical protein [Paraburkholderia kirstenboschensis]WOD13523.1 hypothetical protein RW095_05825 [Paraburkholderia kirstenboschensis]